MTVRIGLTGHVRTLDGRSQSAVNAAYLQATLRAGGVPLILSPLLGTAHAASVLSGLDGVILSGGQDVDPAWYEAAPSPRLEVIDRSRDAFELAIYATAKQRQMPVLAICRGLQLVNVAHGGTLWQDLPTERPGPVDHCPTAPRDARTHGVRLEPGSRTAQLLGATEVHVNSIHHQGISRLGTGLLPTAWAEDRLIEGFQGESESHWLTGVQWHPEEFFAKADAPDQALFAALVEEAERFGRIEMVGNRP